MANKYLILLLQSALVTDNKYNLIPLLQSALDMVLLNGKMITLLQQSALVTDNKYNLTLLLQ